MRYIKTCDDGSNKLNLDDKFTLTSEEPKNILRQLIQVNPYFRSTAKDIVQNPYFDDIRVPDVEVAAPYKIRLPFD